LLVLGGAGGAYFVLIKNKAKGGEGHGEAAAGEAKSGAGGEKGSVNPSLPRPGPSLKMEAFTLNLAPGSAKHVVKVGLELEMKDDGAKAAAEERTAMVRDAVIMYLTGQTDAEIQNNQEQVKAQILKRLNTVLGEGSVKHIYFTELLMQ